MLVILTLLLALCVKALRAGHPAREPNPAATPIASSLFLLLLGARSGGDRHGEPVCPEPPPPFWPGRSTGWPSCGSLRRRRRRRSGDGRHGRDGRGSDGSVRSRADRRAGLQSACRPAPQKSPASPNGCWL